MNRINCKHGYLCALKTGLKPGESYGRSFYVCPVPTNNCGFVHSADVPVYVCPVHNAPVGVQVWCKNRDDTVRYHCCMREGHQWCGSRVLEISEESSVEDSLQPSEGFELLSLPSQDHPDSSQKSGETVELSSEEDLLLASATEDKDRALESAASEPWVTPYVADQSQANSSGGVLGDSVREPVFDTTVANPSKLQLACEENPVGSIEYSVGGDVSVQAEVISDSVELSKHSVSGSLPSDSHLHSGDGHPTEEETISFESIAQVAPSSWMEDPSDSEQASEDRGSVEVIECMSSSEEPSSDSEQSSSPVSHPQSQDHDSTADASNEHIHVNVDSETDFCARVEVPATSTPPLPVVITPSCVDDESSAGIPIPCGSLKQRSLQKSPPMAAASAATQSEKEEHTHGACSDRDTTREIVISSGDEEERKVEDGDEADSGHVAEKQVREPEFQVAHQYRKLVKQYETIEYLLNTMARNLPDGGAKLQLQRQQILERMAHLKRPVPVVDHTATQDGRSAVPKVPNKLGITYQTKMLTSGAVEHLHSSLAECPTEETVIDDPDGLMVQLMPHQKRALAWLLWRETKIPSGGILADDMGLGKTLSMLSLVLKSQELQGGQQHSKVDRVSGEVESAGTLVVCPASLMLQWENEAKTKLKPGLLRTKVYHGPNRTKMARELASFDIVITTYNIVNIEGGDIAKDELPFDTARPDKPKKRSAAATTLFQIKWNRVILDEAHVIRNPSSGTAVGACLLKAEHRWAVTGTPIQNKVKDFFSLIKFLRLAPFDDYRVWREAVDKRGTVGMQRLNTMVSSLVLRRTKQELGPEMLMLTQRLAHTHYIELSEKEDEVYKALFKDAQMIFRQFLRDQGEHHRPSAAVEDSTSVSTLPADVQGVVSRILRQYTSGDSLTSRLSGRAVLVLLLRLRQCCNHLHLLTSALQGSECDERQLDLELAMGAMSLEDEHTDSARISAIPTRFLRDRPSTKVLEVLKRLKEIEKIDDSSPQKSLIISQWTTMLDIMQHQLTVAGISYLRIDGKVPPKQRSSLVNQFNSHARVPMVMLLSLQAGGVGLNLTGANHVFMLDMHWNPAVEEQAADRCHRVGQMRDVFIHRFVCKGTVEQRILDIQEAKLKLSRDVLSGATRRARDNNKLSLNDLKHLFEINQ